MAEAFQNEFMCMLRVIQCALFISQEFKSLHYQNHAENIPKTSQKLLKQLPAFQKIELNRDISAVYHQQGQYLLKI